MLFHAQKNRTYVSECRRYWLRLMRAGDVDIKVVDPRTGRLVKRQDAPSLNEAMKLCQHQEQRRRS